MKKLIRLLYVWVFPLVVVGAIVAAGYFYTQYRKASGANDLAERNRLVKQLSHVMELPSEEPTLATITDKTKLDGQAFFQKAENGDKILIFAQARRAILYRPQTRKIIDVSPINAATSAPTATAPSPSK